MKQSSAGIVRRMRDAASPSASPILMVDALAVVDLLWPASGWCRWFDEHPCCNPEDRRGTNTGRSPAKQSVFLDDAGGTVKLAITKRKEAEASFLFYYRFENATYLLEFTGWVLKNDEPSVP